MTFRRLALSLAALAALRCAAPRPAAPPAALPTPTPAAVPAPTPTPVPFTDVPAPRLDIALALDRASVALPPGAWVIRAGDRLEARSGALTFTSSAATASPALFVVQAGAYALEERARAEAARLSASLGVPAEAVEREGRWGVRVGLPAERSAAELLLARVRQDSVPDAFLVGASPAPPAAGVFFESEAGRESLPSPVEVAAADGSPFPFGDGTWRGHLLLRATGRGTLHVIDRVNLEEYLRGVVPGEMGPKVYDEVEALKAQTVAARSYALRRRGDFAGEGYDLCATPRCQVYGGVAVEQPLTDRAVAETAGEVLVWNGRVADALFTSTCGGRTEHAAAVFPSYARADTPYLAPAECRGEERLSFTATAASRAEPLTLLGVRGRALMSSVPQQTVAAARAALRERLGLPRGEEPRRLAPSAVYADVVASAGIAEPLLLVAPSEVAAAPRDWPERAREAWALCVRFQLAPDLPIHRSLHPEEAAGLYAAFLARLGDMEEIEGRLVASDAAGVTLKTPKGRVSYPPGPRLALFRGGPAIFRPVDVLALVPGDRVRAFAREGKLVALAAAHVPGEGTWERDSSWIHWTRRVTGPELAARLNERDPSRGLGNVHALQVLERASSGRAARLRVVGDRGSFTLAGLEIRFALGIPEDLFVLVSGHAGGVPVFTFFGRGWGHGVGLCQNGAYGMALAGKGYREILGHYYPGAAVGPIPPGS